jgi:hypothetical protein
MNRMTESKLENLCGGLWWAAGMPRWEREMREARGRRRAREGDI